MQSFGTYPTLKRIRVVHKNSQLKILIPIPSYGFDPTETAIPWQVFSAAGIEVEHDAMRGLDHGAWMPLRYMYPDAQIPVAQVSIQPHLGPAHHLALGAALAEFRAANMLVIGSGNLTHNLGEMGRGRGDGALAEWAVEFAEWVRAALAGGRRDALVNYMSHAPNGRRAHPTDEHFLPLFLAMGAAGADAVVERIHTSYTGGAVCNDCYQFA